MNRLTTWCAAALGCAIFCSVAVADEPPQIGDPAPPLDLESVLQGPTDVTLDALRGRWVVLDFFAPWCPGCIAGVDHLNELATTFDANALTVVCLCAESSDTMAAFLNRSPLAAHVVIDRAGATTAAYGIGGYPQAVLINPEGAIAAFLRPESITIERARAQLAGEAVEWPDERFEAAGGQGDPDWITRTTVGAADTIAEVVLRYSSARERTFLRYRRTPGRILGDGVRVSRLLEHAYDVSRYELDNRLGIDARYQVSVVAATPDHDAARGLLRGVLEASLGFEPRWDERMTEFVVIRYDPELGSDAFAASQAGTPRDGFAGRAGFHLTSTPIDFITTALGDYAFEQPVIDETGLTGDFDLDVDWNPADPSTIEAALQRVGLVITREQRSMRVLIIEAGPISD